MVMGLNFMTDTTVIARMGTASTVEVMECNGLRTCECENAVKHSSHIIYFADTVTHVHVISR